MKAVDPSSLREQYYRYSRPEYESLLSSVITKIRSLLELTSLRFQIKHRVKEFEEYLKKLNLGTDGKPRSNRIEDLMGIRIVCPFLEDLNDVKSILSAHFDIAEVDEKRQGHSFSEFGYDSTHLMLVLEDREILHPLPYAPLVCEIQLRTILQDAWAEVEHELIYKSSWSIPTYQIRRKLAALNANLTLGDIIFQELRDFQREVFTKQSKRRSLTADSLAMLSQNEIHEELLDDANNCGARDDLEKIIISALNAHVEESFETAIALYSRALETPAGESIRSILLNHRGMAHLALGNSETAHAEFLAAIDCDPSNYRAWYNIGTVYKLLGKASRAMEAFTVCLRTNPLFSEARVRLIYLFLELGSADKAEEEIAKLRRYSPDSPELTALEGVMAKRGIDTRAK